MVLPTKNVKRREAVVEAQRMVAVAKMMLPRTRLSSSRR
jgi:hypothetical protein